LRNDFEVLIRAYAAPGPDQDLDRGRAALTELRDIATTVQTSPLLASASLAAGLIAVADGNRDLARRELEDAVDLFDRSGAPFEAARARMNLALVLEQLNRAPAAIAEVDRALEALTGLDAKLDASIAREMRERMAGRPPGKPGAGARDTSGLSTGELEVWRWISAGLSNHAIAERLFISEHTVHRHVANMLSKLDVPSRSAAVAHAAKRGLL